MRMDQIIEEVSGSPEHLILRSNSGSKEKTGEEFLLTAP